MSEQIKASGGAGRGSRKPDRRSRPGRKRPKKPSRFAPGEPTARRKAADARAAELVPVLAGLREEGISAVRRVAVALTERGIPTARGGPWHAREVQRLLVRIEALPERP
jgi:hypothetical protein